MHVEDLVDTGLTVGYLVSHLEAQGPRRVDVCTLLDRPARRILPVPVRYVGVEIPDVFVLGYGLHHADLYRLAGGGDDQELGLEELPGPRGVLAIEWAERLSVHPWDPALAVRVTLEHAGDDARRVRIEKDAA